jgi:hypothetical protein
VTRGKFRDLAIGSVRIVGIPNEVGIEPPILRMAGDPLGAALR